MSKTFPKISTTVKPLYDVPNRLPSPDHSGLNIGEKSSSKRPIRTFDYRTSVKILKTKMYEPVSDGVVTVITPKYSLRGGVDFDRSDDDDDDGGEDDTTVVVDARATTTTIVQPDEDGNNKMIAANNCCGNGGARFASSAMGDNNCIDVEHINFRNKYKSAAVQTSQLTPYRLRFWPKSAFANLKCIDGGYKEVVKCCLKTLSQWFLSQIGLTVILFIWALLGATAFYKTEGPREKQQSEDLEKLKKTVAVELSTDLRQTAGHEEAWPRTIEKYLMKHEALLLEAVSAGYGEGGGGSIWTYPGCILFAVALLTTLGFGAPVPRTPLARGAAVLFSAVGIPLHFLLIANMGTLAAGALQHLATVKPTSELPEVPPTRRKWIKWFPFVSIVSYYTLGVIFFGVLRERTAVESLMFPLDFTAAGGVAKTSGHVRILYALYLEMAMTLAAVVVSLLQASATRGIIDFGLRLGLLTNT